MLVLRNLGILLFVARLGCAQTASSSPTSSAPAATHSVNVGAAGLVFTPNSLTANIGDTVEFRFYPQNHSVARAEYKNPCIPYEVVDVGKQGFWSGFKPVAVVLSDPPNFGVLVNDSQPIFFYCSAPGACEHDLMVGVINPNSTQTLEVQQAFAANSTIMFSPGENFPEEVAPTTKTSAPSSTSASSTGPTSAATTTATTAPSHHDAGLSAGAIAGIAIGAAAVLILGGALVYLCGRQRTLGELLRHNHPTAPPPSYVPSPSQAHMSMASSAAYSKSPQFSPPPGSEFYRGENDSYRSRSPPVDDGMEYSRFGAVSPNREREGSPMIRRPTPQSPGRPPVTLSDRPMSETLGNIQGIGRTRSQFGPHELGVENSRENTPYSSPRFG